MKNVVVIGGGTGLSVMLRGMKQIENINYLKNHVGLDNLPAKLREIAVLRLAHPDVSLQELGAMMPSGQISKSGVNHRLRKLNQIAEGYQQPEDA